MYAKPVSISVVIVSIAPLQVVPHAFKGTTNIHPPIGVSLNVHLVITPTNYSVTYAQSDVRHVSAYHLGSAQYAITSISFSTVIVKHLVV